MCIIRLGDFVEGIINVVTLGWGKPLAEWVAHKLGYQDCGCERRRIWLNKLLKCKERGVQL